MPIQKIDIAETNLALFGSEIEKKLKHKTAESEPAWQGCGQKEGIQVWRIEKFQVKDWPSKCYGQFYEGDSYIILQTYKKTPDATALSHNIFFWLGETTTQDEAGTAAYKTVELDDYFHGEPVQYREVHGNESSKFLTLFPHIEILKGGVESGFRHVETKETHQIRLLHVKGTRKYLRVLEVDAKASSLNAGDCFILDEGKIIRVWQGETSSPFERNKAVAYAREVAGDKKKVEVLAQHDTESATFYSAIGGNKESVGPATPDASPPNKKLYRLSDASGEFVFSPVESSKITKSSFESNDVFVLDVGEQVFVWIGKETSENERRGWMKYADEYLKRENRNVCTPIVKLTEGCESHEFVECLDR